MMATCYGALMASDLDVHEAAEAIGVSVSTVREMIRDGRLPGHRSETEPGRPHRVRAEDAEQARRSREITPDDLAEVAEANAAFLAAERQRDEARKRRDDAILRTYAALCERRGASSRGRPSLGVASAIAEAIGMHRVSISDIVGEKS